MQAGEYIDICFIKHTSQPTINFTEEFLFFIDFVFIILLFITIQLYLIHNLLLLF